jgi:hypothetical protein
MRHAKSILNFIKPNEKKKKSWSINLQTSRVQNTVDTYKLQHRKGSIEMIVICREKLRQRSGLGRKKTWSEGE